MKIKWVKNRTRKNNLEVLICVHRDRVQSIKILANSRGRIRIAVKGGKLCRKKWYEFERLIKSCAIVFFSLHHNWTEVLQRTFSLWKFFSRTESTWQRKVGLMKILDRGRIKTIKSVAHTRLRILVFFSLSTELYGRNGSRYIFEMTRSLRERLLILDFRFVGETTFKTFHFLCCWVNCAIRNMLKHTAV